MARNEKEEEMRAEVLIGLLLSVAFLRSGIQGVNALKGPPSTATERCSVVVDDDFGPIGDTLYGTMHFNRIQEAINYVCNNCSQQYRIVVVQPGTYFRAWGFDNGLGNYDSTDIGPIDIPCDNLTLTGDASLGIPKVTTVASPPNPLLRAEGKNSIKISFIQFTGSTSTVSDPTEYAIKLDDVDNLEFSHNEVVLNFVTYALLLSGQSYNPSYRYSQFIWDNWVHRNGGWGTYAVDLSGYSPYTLNLLENVCDSNYYDGIGLKNVKFAQLSSNQLRYNGYASRPFVGISVMDSSRYCLLTQNQVSHNTWGGIWLGGPRRTFSIDIISNVVDSNGTMPFGGFFHGGVTLAPSVGYFNVISQNSMFDNGGIGIDLNDDGVTVNDVGDPDDGPNTLLNYPVFTGAQYLGGNSYQLVGVAQPGNLIEVFIADGDPTGYGEGREYLGSTYAGAGGFFTIVVVTSIVNPVFTSTARDQNGNTSEFGPNITVPTRVQEEEEHRFSLKVDPTPSCGKVNMVINLSQRSLVELRIFDVSGRLVKEVFRGFLEPGNRVFSTGEGVVKSGVYFVYLKVDGTERTERVLLLNE